MNRNTLSKVVFILCIALIAIIGLNYITLGPSWDGAMNLLPAKNLALYGKYYSFYYDEFFPRPIQTRFTLQIPSSLFYYLFGINSFSLGLTSFIYVIALSVLFFFYGKTLGFRQYSGFFTLIPLLVPIYYNVALRGYGEFIAFFFVFLSLYLLARDNKPSLFLSGLCLGLAIITKTVALIVVPAVIAVWILKAVVSRRNLFKFLLFFFFGVCIALIIYFAFQIVILGFSDWVDWMVGQISGTKAQAGVSAVLAWESKDPFKDMSPWKTFWRRLELTANNSGMPLYLLLLYFVVGLVTSLTLFVKNWSNKIGIFILFTTTVFLIYMIWWHFITPYIKMAPLGKFRRIAPAFLCLGFNYMVATISFLDKNKNEFGRRFYDLLAGSILLLIILTVVFSVNHYIKSYSFIPRIHNESSEFVNELNQAQLDGVVFGYGYRQSPQLALMTKGNFDDVFKYDIDEVISLKNKYVILDSYSIATGAFNEFLQIFDHEVIAYRGNERTPNAKLIRLGDLRTDPFDYDFEMLSCINRSSNLQGYEGQAGSLNGRWFCPVGLFRLSGKECHSVNIGLYVPNTAQGYFDGTGDFEIFVNDSLYLEGILHNGLNRFFVPLKNEKDTIYDFRIVLDSYHKSGSKYYGFVLNELCLNCEFNRYEVVDSLCQVKLLKWGVNSKNEAWFKFSEDIKRGLITTNSNNLVLRRNISTINLNNFNSGDTLRIDNCKNEYLFIIDQELGKLRLL